MKNTVNWTMLWKISLEIKVHYNIGLLAITFFFFTKSVHRHVLPRLIVLSILTTSPFKFNSERELINYVQKIIIPNFFFPCINKIFLPFHINSTTIIQVTCSIKHIYKYKITHFLRAQHTQRFYSHKKIL